MRVVTGYDGCRPRWSESEPSSALIPGFGAVDLSHAIPLSKSHRGDPHAARKRKRLAELEARRADGRATPEEMQASRLRGNAAMQAARARR